MRQWLRRTFTLIWLVAPYVIRMVVRMLVAGYICFRFLWDGVDERCLELGRVWTTRTVTERDGLSLYEPELLSIFTFAAWLTVIAGWIICSYITVWIVPIVLRVIFLP